MSDSSMLAEAGDRWVDKSDATVKYLAALDESGIMYHVKQLYPHQVSGTIRKDMFENTCRRERRGDPR